MLFYSEKKDQYSPVIFTKWSHARWMGCQSVS